jgi:hypothetical protein
MMIQEGKDARGRTIYMVGDRWFYTREKAERAAGPAGAAGAAAPRSTVVGFLLGGGTITTTGDAVRPFAVVEVSPGKRRAFYMSTGTGGHTPAGSWNLFGGISSNGWFIKPYEGKRVAKYDAVEAALGAALGRTPAAAQKALQALPNALHVAQASPSDLAAAAALKRTYDVLYAKVWDKPPGSNWMEWLDSPESRAFAAQRDEVGRAYNALVKSFGMGYAEKLNRYLEQLNAVAPDVEQPIGFHTVAAAKRANPRTGP